MTNGPNKVLDEFAKLMTDAAGVAQGMRREAETAFKAQAERFLNNMDLVQREDFDAAREMAANARNENDKLAARLDELEKRVVALEGGARRAPRKSAKAAGSARKPVKRAKKAG